MPLLKADLATLDKRHWQGAAQDATPCTMQEAWLDDLPERLLTHYVGGAWRAPLGSQMCPVRALDGRVLGQMVCATHADIARAVALTHAPDRQTRLQFGTALRNAAPDLIRDLGDSLTCTLDSGILSEIAQDYRALKDILDLPEHSLQHQAVFLVPAEYAVLGVVLARVAQAAGLPAGAIALLHAPHNDQMKREP